MTARPLLLDLFSGAGGAAMGYHRAGFDVIGVDLHRQPNYPFRFVQADALDPPFDLTEFDAIHASPPCQAFTTARVIYGNDHPDLVEPTRDMLNGSGVPWVMENVPGAPLRRDVVLCGSMFGLQTRHGRLRRHRLFEFSDPHLALVPPCDHSGPTISVFGHGGHVYHGVDDWREVMGIDWMTRDELAEAIPPAYTEWVGSQLLAHLGVAA